MRTRIAPTPSGFLHIGNLYSFVLTWLMAKSRNGSVLLRIDDLDAARMRPAYLEDIFRTLEFIGLVPDEGPSGVEDFLKNFSQMHRVADYLQCINKLKETGQVYACSCSRSRIMAENSNGIYPGTCRSRNLDFGGGAFALRLALKAGTKVQFCDSITGEENNILLEQEMGDFVVLRKDGIPAYQVASLVDDIHYGINLVVRGKDLLSSTAAQLHLAKVMGADQFSAIEWHHHPLIKNEQEQKLSKSAGDMSVRKMIEKGGKRADFICRIASLMALPEKRLKTLHDLQIIFEESGFKSGSRRNNAILNKN